MRHRGHLQDILHRAETGPIMVESEFEKKLITSTIQRLIKEFGIAFDGETIIPCDDDLPDRLFQAGLVFAEQVGLFCQDTSRRMIWTRNELLEGIAGCPKEALLGEGTDAVLLESRVPEDKKHPLISGGPYGIPTSEELFSPMLLSYAKERLIDTIDPPSLESAYGLTIKAASPLEALAGWREAELALQVVRQAGRPGMSIGCVALSSTPYSELSATSYGGYRPSDRHYIGLLSEFKTNYHMLTKVVHTVRIGGHMHAYYNAIYGGYLGGVEGLAIAVVAATILLNQAYMGTTYGANVEHPFLGCNTRPELLWALSAATQAFTKNTNLMSHCLFRSVGGPGTHSMLLENATFSTALTVSGVSLLACGHTATGKHARHASGLEARFAAEVARATSGMSLEEANALVQRLIPLYESDMDSKPIGKPFEEVYDVEKIEPTPEWQGIYDEAREELIKMGLPLDRLVY